MRVIIALVLLVVAAAAVDLAPLLLADSPLIIHGSYIVVLKEGIDLHARDAHISDLKALIDDRGDDESEIRFTYHMESFVGFSARFSPQILKAELSHPDVKYIECDQEVSIDYIQEKQTRAPVDTTQTGATWGLDRIDQRQLPLNGEYIYNTAAGRGVDVYVIDTGILVTHVDFGGRATSVFNSIITEPPTDLNGHGTHCAGTVGGNMYGVAKEVDLKSVKVINTYGIGESSGVIAGFDYITNHKNNSRKSVASVSLSNPASQAWDDAVNASITSGVVYVVCAGNYHLDACDYSPARLSTAITVGATDRNDFRAKYSNFGPCVDIFAPGTNVKSDWIGLSNTADMILSGTSMATPHVAGTIALHLSLDSSLDPATCKSWVVDVGTHGVVNNTGDGSPNVLLYSPH